MLARVPDSLVFYYHEFIEWIGTSGSPTGAFAAVPATMENSAPVWIGSTDTLSIADGGTLDLQTLFTDADGDTLTFLIEPDTGLLATLEGAIVQVAFEPAVSEASLTILASDEQAIESHTVTLQKTESMLTPLVVAEPTIAPAPTIIPTPTSAVIVEPVAFTPSAFTVESIGSTSPANGTPNSVDAQGINDGFSGMDSVDVATISTGNDAYVGLLQTNGLGSLDLEGYLNMSYNISNITTQAGVSLTNFTFFLDHCFGGDTAAPVTCGVGAGGTIENSAIELYNFSGGAYKKVSDWIGTDTSEGTHKFNVTQGLADFVSATEFVNIRYAVNVTISAAGRDGSLGADLSVMEVAFTASTTPTVCQTIGAGVFLMNNSVNTTSPSCYNFSANNAVLDCDGNAITGAQVANSHGVNASSRTNITIRNCAISNFTDGVFFTRVKEGLLFNNTVNNNTDDGIDWGNTNFSVITHNLVANNTDNGIEITGWFDNITNNTVSNNRGAATSHGIQTFRGNANIPGSGPATYRIINNTVFDNQNDGISTAWLNNSVIANNTLWNNGDDDLSLSNNTGLNVTGNNLGHGGDDGFVLDGTNYSFFAFNNISEKKGQNIDMLKSVGNNFTNNTIYYGYFDLLRLRLNSVNNTFWNTTLFSNNSWLSFNDTSTLNNNFTNTTFANSNGSIRLSFFQGNISQEINTTKLNISNNRAYLNATNFSNMNVSAVITLNLSGVGLSNPGPLIDYDDTQSYVTCPEDICSISSSSANQLTFNVTHWTSFAAEEVPIALACGDTITTNTVMTEDVSGTGTCVTMGADDITLDCAGYKITYDTSGSGAAYGVQAVGR
ncbi:MAG: right-handed parallel beta-helix repeat-containing protein, partial [Nanoarchaeota archaeon]